MAVSKRTRFEVLKRDEYTCRYCRSKDGELTIDHVVPVALGGGDGPENLVAACRDCNAGKSSSTPQDESVKDVDAASVAWSAAMKRAAEIRAERRSVVDEYVAAFDRIWSDLWKLPWNYDQSLEALMKAGLPRDLMEEAVYITINARGVSARFNYFCGIAWRRISELQEIAAELIASEKEAENGAN